jgi:L,D-transpeptidase ErfK/SrfK
MKAGIRLIKTIGFSLCILLPNVFAGISEYDIPEPGNDIVGKTYTINVKKGDSLTSIRQEHDISYEELLEANPKIDFYKIKVGQQVIVPKQFILPKLRRGVVINIPELRLYFFNKEGTKVYTFPVGLGREDWRTPLISTSITKKVADPAWYPPASIREYMSNKGIDLPDVVKPGPKNPLGQYALHLRIPGYLIHGTDKQTSVGTFVSSGCMRLMREPIEFLYQAAEIGTPVNVMHSPTKVGWQNNKLYIESHKPIEGYESSASSLNIDPEEALYDAIHLRPATINWDVVSKTIHLHLGVPEPIGIAT